MQDYIKIPDLKPGYLYQIRARNGRYGIWLPQRNSFVLSREKFGFNCLFEEYHYDTGAPFGTVLPIEEIEKSPFEADTINEVWCKAEGAWYIGYKDHDDILYYLNDQKEISEPMIALDTVLCTCKNDKSPCKFVNCGADGYYSVCTNCNKPIYIVGTKHD